MSPAAKPVPSMTLTASSTHVRITEPPVLTVRMPADATGEVGFYDFARPGADKGIGVAPVIDGVATLTMPDRPLVLGDNPIQASYGGNAIYAAADSNLVTVVAVSKPVPPMTLTASSTQVLVTEPPVLTVRMPPDATGEVGFYDAARPGADKGIGVAPIVDGVATLTAPDRPLVLGDNPIRASYGGNAIYAAADSNLVTVVAVSRLTPMLKLTASSTILLLSHWPTLTVHMPTDATGMVSFHLYHFGRTYPLGMARNVGGIASIAPPYPSLLGFIPGSYRADASYGGNARYTGVYSNEVTLTVVGLSHTLAFTGGRQTVRIPLGASKVKITATGGSGAMAPPCGAHTVVGGFGAAVTGTAAITAGADLIIDVGGAGYGRAGGWGGAAGGGDGGHRGGIFSGTGAGGGGATAVQLSHPGESTLLIAGGGGGGGDCGEFFAVGGNGGSAGLSAGGGHNASGGISPGDGGKGGGAPTPAGEPGSGAGGGGGGGAAGGRGGTGSSSGAAGGGGGAGSTVTNNLTGVTIATASTTGNGTVTLHWSG